MTQRLSARQEECLRLTAFLTDKEIATRLGLSEATVKKHVHEACRRLGVNRRKAALALLERNVPGQKHPIAAPVPSGLSDPAVTESDDGYAGKDASSLDVGRSGSGPGRVQPPGAERSGSGASDARSGGRRGEGEPPRTVAAGPERGLGDGPGGGPGGSPGGGPERRLGYRPPPGSWLFRLLILATVVIVGAIMVKAVADMVVDYTHQARAIDRAVYERPSPAPS